MMGMLCDIKGEQSSVEQGDEPGADELTGPTVLQMQRWCRKKGFLRSNKKVNPGKTAPQGLHPAWQQPKNPNIHRDGSETGSPNNSGEYSHFNQNFSRF